MDLDSTVHLSLEDGHPELEHVHIEITVVASEGDLLAAFKAL